MKDQSIFVWICCFFVCVMLLSVVLGMGVFFGGKGMSFFGMGFFDGRMIEDLCKGVFAGCVFGFFVFSLFEIIRQLKNGEHWKDIEY